MEGATGAEEYMIDNSEFSFSTLLKTLVLVSLSKSMIVGAAFRFFVLVAPSEVAGGE